MPPGNQARIVSEELFELITELEIQKALRLQYPISVLTLLIPSASAETPEGTRLVDQMASVISRVLRSTDAVARHPSLPGLRVLLVDTALGDADVVIRRITEELRQVVTLRFGAACFPATARSGAELVLLADSHAERDR